MASQKAISANPYKKNSSTVLGGNATSSTTNDLTIRESSVPQQSTLPVVSAYQGNQKAASSRVFAGLTASNFVIMATPFSIGGVASTVLRSPSSAAGQKFNNVTSSRQSTLTGLAWADSTDLPTYTFTRSASTITYTTDNAVNPRVTFLYGAPNPTTSTV